MHLRLLSSMQLMKGEIKAAAKVWNITHYVLPKITGTRFIGHRRNAFTHFVDMWPALISAFENIVADKKTTKATQEKVNTFLEKLKSYKFVNLVCCYLDILDSITPASKIFEADELLPYEVMSIAKETIANIDDILDDKSNEFSHVATYTIKGNQLIAMFKRGDETRRKEEDREKHEISLEDIRELKKSSVEIAVDKKKEMCGALKEILQSKFNDFEDPKFRSMTWFDPKNWDIENKNYGNDPNQNSVCGIQRTAQLSKVQ